MTRLIDADALSMAMYHEAMEKDSDFQRWDSGCWIRYKLFENVLKAQPTIEAEPVRHGKWIEKSTGGEHFACCSECGYVEWDTLHNYCPNCGARMDNDE